VSFRTTLSDLKWLSEIFSDTKRCAVSATAELLVQISTNTWSVCTGTGYLCCNVNVVECSNFVVCYGADLWYWSIPSTVMSSYELLTHYGMVQPLYTIVDSVGVGQRFFITNQSTFSGSLLISYN